MQLNKNLVSEIKSIIDNARERAVRSVDYERVLMYWEIGRVIFEEEQKGLDRAKYGEFLIKSLSDMFLSLKYKGTLLKIVVGYSGIFILLFSVTTT